MDHSVTQLKEGNFGTVRRFTDERMAGKLITMGVLPGSKVQVVRIAPFNGGYYLKVDGTNMVLRATEADSIVLEVLAGS
jgi:ferrous iron transport protein A